MTVKKGPVNNARAAEAIVTRLQQERAKLIKRSSGSSPKLTAKEKDAKSVAKEATSKVVEERGPKQRATLTPKLQNKPVKSLAADAKTAATAAGLRSSPVVKKQGNPAKLARKAPTGRVVSKGKAELNPKVNTPPDERSVSAKQKEQAKVNLNNPQKASAARRTLDVAESNAKSQAAKAAREANVEREGKEAQVSARIQANDSARTGQVQPPKAERKTQEVVEQRANEGLKLAAKAGVGPKPGAKPDLQLTQAAKKKIAEIKTANYQIKRGKPEAAIKVHSAEGGVLADAHMGGHSDVADKSTAVKLGGLTVKTPVAPKTNTTTKTPVKPNISLKNKTPLAPKISTTSKTPVQQQGRIINP